MAFALARPRTLLVPLPDTRAEGGPEGASPGSLRTNRCLPGAQDQWPGHRAAGDPADAFPGALRTNRCLLGVRRRDPRAKHPVPGTLRTNRCQPGKGTPWAARAWAAAAAVPWRRQPSAAAARPVEAAASDG